MWLWTMSASTSNDGDETSEGDEPDDAAEGEGDNAPGGAYVLDYDTARKVAMSVGADLTSLPDYVEVKGTVARLIPAEERARKLFEARAEKQQAAVRPGVKAAKGAAKEKQPGLHFPGFDHEAAAASAHAARRSNVPAATGVVYAGDELAVRKAVTPVLPGVEDHMLPVADRGPKELLDFDAPLEGTLLDRVHQSMLLFQRGRTAGLRALLVDAGHGRDARFWKLAQSLSALYPARSAEKRMVDGVMARKKSLGL